MPPKIAAGPKPIKIVVVGDGTVGKTCMLIAHTTGEFPTEYIPTIFDNYVGRIECDGMSIDVTYWDTAGQEDYERLRPLSYPNTDVFLLCYSVDNPTSYNNVLVKWAPEVRHYCPKAAVVLVGTKTDLRDRPDAITVSSREGHKLKSKIKANKYIECSALTREGLRQVYEEAVRAVLKPTTRRSTKCQFL
jgi:Ras-related C3 botulinum toxin substrate 1